MNTVYVSLVKYGPNVLVFQSAANDFIGNINIALEKLRAMGYTDVNPYNIYVSVR